MRSLRKILASLPLTFKVPLLVAFLTIIVAVVISQVVLSRLAKEQAKALDNLTSAFMDGLSASTTPGMLRQDVWETFDSLDRVRRQYGSMKLLYILAALPDGEILAASDPDRFPVRSQLPSPVAETVAKRRDLIIDETQQRAWLTRQIQQEGYLIGTLVAEVDISDILAVRREIQITLVLVNGALTLLFSAAGYLLVRRMVAPLSLIERKLADAASGHVTSIEDGHIARVGGEYSKVFRQFNAMIQDQAERKALAAEIANQEKLALLGRLASSMAHEVNNPLGGLMNAVDTLDTYGDNEETRRRTISLLRRGLNGIQQVVRAALATYKAGDNPLLLTRSDLEDLPFLIQHETGSKQLALAWDNQFETDVQIDAGTIRQIALNLLLNACAASPERGSVAFQASIEGSALRISIRDDGPGMSANGRAFLDAGFGGEEPPRGTGLGLWTVGRLAARLKGTISVVNIPGGGCKITLSAPIAHNEENLRAVA